MAMKLLMLVIFFAIMVSVGIYARKHATSVDGYVLGGRSVGPWLTAFAYGTSYFSAVVFVGYAVSSDGNTVLRRHGSESEMRSSEVCWHGWYLEDVPR